MLARTSSKNDAYSQLLLAAVALCVEDGLRSPSSIEMARALEVEGNIFADDELRDSLERLPASAVEAVIDGITDVQIDLSTRPPGDSSKS